MPDADRAPSAPTPQFFAGLEQTLRAELVARQGGDLRLRALYALVVWLQTSETDEYHAPHGHPAPGLPYCGRCGEWHGCCEGPPAPPRERRRFFRE